MEYITNEKRKKNFQKLKKQVIEVIIKNSYDFKNLKQDIEIIKKILQNYEDEGLNKDFEFDNKKLTKE